jgi:hypothetical protein
MMCGGAFTANITGTLIKIHELGKGCMESGLPGVFGFRMTAWMAYPCCLQECFREGRLCT